MPEQGQLSNHPQPQAAETPQFREIPPDIQKILNDHQEWVKTAGKKGQRADLRNADLRNLDLTNVNFYGAILQGAIFQGANLEQANLRQTNLLFTNFSGAIGLDKLQLRSTNTWILAFYDDETLAKLQLPAHHNKTIVEKKFIHANLEEANLQEGDLQGADLTGANLKNANLQNANFHEAELLGANLQDAYLKNADLTGAKNLLVKNLARADVTDAQLPEDVAKFTELDNLAEASKNCRTQLFAILLGCAYTWLTVLYTTDAGLLTNAAVSKLPFIGTSVKIVPFYVVAPILLLAFYVYFHLNLQNLYEGLAALPAIFPDGRRLDQRAYPWLLNKLVCLSFPRLKGKKTRPPSARQQVFVSFILAWGLIPLTLLLIWVRYLTRMIDLVTSLHIVLLSGSLAVGVRSYRIARVMLRGREVGGFSHGLIVWMTGLGSIVIFYFIFLGVAIGPSSYATDYEPSFVRLIRGVADAFSLIGYSFYANLVEVEVSTNKPPNWTCTPEQISQVKGAYLKGRNLTYAEAMYAFLVKADLRGAILYKANLQGAELQGANGLKVYEVRRARNWPLAFYDQETLKTLGLPSNHNQNVKQNNLSNSNLEGADLQKADLQKTNLQGANLQEANLREANLYANLREANLRRANLSEASLSWGILQGAELQEANLRKANLRGANLQGAELQGARGLEKNQVRQARNWPLAFYDQETLKTLGLPSNHNQNVKQNNLSNYNLLQAFLANADLRKTNLQGANLQGANLYQAGISEANLQKAILYEANLREADLQGADLQGANLREADLREANLKVADLIAVNLQGANLQGVNLQEAGLQGANLYKANLKMAELGSAILKGANLQEAKGLTQDQLDSAKTDENTKLPDYLKKGAKEKSKAN